ncbi:hypothetical protein GGE45_004263 [Rhizobium aethiopicum]|uniref:Uncharacterized protein n=1 Tax=Rhizobium aethiopicum TaxID=1138170 RepID=A0A7W6MJA9_9HYPH|nr:hypothetical protein [Rhizobium aethiopicum]MBB4193748.1 hypothetical protein [Rhizobium aethiopicum]MBB4581910.1 hypothetical protein [Rhizobium aethiopicum]
MVIVIVFSMARCIEDVRPNGIPTILSEIVAGPIHRIPGHWLATGKLSIANGRQCSRAAANPRPPLAAAPETFDQIVSDPHFSSASSLQELFTASGRLLTGRSGPALGTESAQIARNFPAFGDKHQKRSAVLRSVPHLGDALFPDLH